LFLPVCTYDAATAAAFATFWLLWRTHLQRIVQGVVQCWLIWSSQQLVCCVQLTTQGGRLSMQLGIHFTRLLQQLASHMCDGQMMQAMKVQ
jgi:hypothetical protein